MVTLFACDQRTTNAVIKLLPEGEAVNFCKVWGDAQSLWEGGQFTAALAKTEGVYNAARKKGNEAKLPAGFLSLQFNFPPDLLDVILSHQFFPAELKVMAAKCKTEEDFQMLVENLKTQIIMFIALIRSESRFNPSLVSGAGAVGLGQLKMSTAREVADKIGMKSFDLKNSRDNIKLSFAFFSSLAVRFGVYEIGSLDLFNPVIIAYKFGHNGIYHLFTDKRKQGGCDYDRRCFSSRKPEAAKFLNETETYYFGISQHHGARIGRALDRALRRYFHPSASR